MNDSQTVLSRHQIIATAMRAARADENEVTALALTIRRVAALRGVVLLRALVSEVVRLLEPIWPTEDLLGDVEREVETLARLGDLIVRRPAARSPEIVELASGALVVLETGTGPGALVLGRLEAALPAATRERIRVHGHLRTLARDEVDAGLLDEIDFQGCSVLEWRRWCEAPEPMAASLLLSRTMEQGTRYNADGTGFDVFDPHSAAWLYRDRFRPGALRQIADRDGWAAARYQPAFGPREYSLFGTASGDLRRADVPRGAFARVVGACAYVAGGKRLLARRDVDRLRLHFPPPAWLDRLLATATPLERMGALVAVELPSGMGRPVEDLLERLLFCEVRPDDHVG